MNASQTELACSNEMGGACRPFSSPADQMTDEQDPEASREDRLTRALSHAPTDRLKTALTDQIKKLNTAGALRVSAELTARKIAPCFRGISTEPAWWLGNHDADFILLVADLQWIVTTYPNHVTEWERASRIFDPTKLMKTAEYLHWTGYRTPGQIAKALGLTEQQQRECAWIQCLHIERWRRRLFKRLPLAQSKITATVRSRDKRPIVDQDATIKRRSNLWLCAELAEWKPQRTANLYASMTGEILPRNLVARQLEKLPKVRRVDEVITD